MLSKLHYQHYQHFLQELEQLRAIVTRQQPDARSLHERFLTAQQFFQQTLVALEPDLLDATAIAKVQAFQTEINKQLRLLGTDVMFLQAARQSTTVQQRQAQMRDRLDLLMQYCQALMQAD